MIYIILFSMGWVYLNELGFMSEELNEELLIVFKQNNHKVSRPFP